MSTIYIVEHGSSLKVKHQQFNVWQQKKLLLKAPVTEIANIIIFGYCHLSHGAIQTALFHKIPITYYSHQGYYLGCLQSKWQPKATYLIEQIRKTENDYFIRKQAETIVRAKLNNSRILLMRLNARHLNNKTKIAITELRKITKCLDIHPPLESIRGYEGKGANIYFQGLAPLFKGEFDFTERTLRPPKDPINSLLGFGYTLLYQQLVSIVQLAGLHTDFGHLHTFRENHPALVLDLMEEFRAQIVDSLVVYLVNQNIVSPQDFTLPNEKGAVYLKQESLKTFLQYWSEKLLTQITHPQSQQKVSLHTCLNLQVKEYISYLTGKTNKYQPMLWQK